MAKFSRRTFLKVVGGATMSLSMGLRLPGRLWAAGGGGVTVYPPPCEDWEFFYPGKYDKKDTETLTEYWAKLDKISNWGDVNINDLITGKLDDTPKVSWNPFEHKFKVTAESMEMRAKNLVPNVPVFNDREYAKKTKYGDLIAYPLVLTYEVFPAMPKDAGLGDLLVVSSHNDAITFHKPMYAGDTIFTIYDEQHCIDITPAEGSYYRTFALSGTAKGYNQRGELVAEGAGILKESYRRHKDPAQRNQDGAHTWESPNWLDRKPHQYTDEDWEYIFSIWKNEKTRHGVLYWDDVNIGDEPAPNAVGPMLTEKAGGMIMGTPQWMSDFKKDYLADPKKALASVSKTKHGIYVPHDKLEQQNDILNPDNRGVLQNAVCPGLATSMLYNWMGDEGWLQTIGWEIMASPIPGFPDSVIPPIPDGLRPALFDKYPYMNKVPYMKGKLPNWHALVEDIIINKAYVFDKYKKDKEYFVDLAWWSETVDGTLVEQGWCTIKLPKRT